MPNLSTVNIMGQKNCFALLLLHCMYSRSQHPRVPGGTILGGTIFGVHFIGGALISGVG